MTTIPVPDGRIHRPGLLARGWTATMINALTDVQKLPGGSVPEGVSNKHYALAEVEQLEATDPAIKKAVAAHRSQIPRITGDVAFEDTWSRTALLERGWTATYITRYLGHPDLMSEGLGTNPSHRWAISRIRQAEAADAKLAARITQKHEQAQAERQDRIDQVLETGQAVWRKVNGTWLIQGKNLTVGQIVTVTRRSGDAETHKVDSIVTTDGDVVTARSHRYTAPVPRTGRPVVPVATASVPAAPLPPQAPLTVIATRHRPEAGDQVWLTPPFGPVTTITVTRVIRRVDIDDDMPSIYGPHLLDNDGGTGWLVEYKPVEKETK